MSTSRRITFATFKSGDSNVTNQGIFIKGSSQLDRSPRTRVTVRESQEDGNRHMTNDRARVRSYYSTQYGNDVGDAEVIVPTLFAREPMQRHCAHRRDRIIERSKEGARGFFICIMVKKEEAPAPGPRVRVKDSSGLHFCNGTLSGDAISLLVR